MNRIRMFDYLEQYRGIRDETLDAVERVLASGQLILGPEGSAFEEEFAAYLGGAGQCVGVNSGTDALAVALRALEIGPGDEVITVANTPVPTVSAIRMVGAVPVFCDVELRTGLMDLGSVPACITDKTRAVIPVHLFGNVVDVPRLREILGGPDIHIVEDCAQAHGAKLRGRCAGTMGDIGAFSFYPTKNLGAYGDAGLCFSADAELVKRMRSIRKYGFEDLCYSEREGINTRLDEVQAAVLRVKLNHLPDWLERRRRLAEEYDRHLAPGIQRVSTGAGVAHGYHLYVVRVPNRDAVREVLSACGIDTGVHPPFPIHLMRGYAFLGYKPGALPNTETLAAAVLSLPLYPELPAEAVRRVCDELNDAVS